jgi:two-component system, OmpR family, catabolic regulation response regulator CreB
MPHILIVEDEPSIADTLLFVLRAEGFIVTWKSQAGEALDLLKNTAVDLVIMDVGLPDFTGFEACKQLRRFSDVPVMFLTARGDELDRVVGLEIGADDYVVKPFSPREVAARVKAILKRVVAKQPMPATNITKPTVSITKPTASITKPTASINSSQDAISAEEFVIDLSRKQIYFHGKSLALTKLEFCLLQTLVAQPERVFSRDQLLAAAGVSVDASYDRSVDGHIKTLRAKLREINGGTEPIKTLRGFGYCYQPELR